MKFRTLLRNEALQLKLENRGAAIFPFLIPENISWLLEVFAKGDIPTLKLYEELNEKLQSKVEYRCVNCSPFQIYFTHANTPTKVILQQSITDENRYASLHLIAPLWEEAGDELVFEYLAGAHLLPALPRGKNIPLYFKNDRDYVQQNFSTLKIKTGEAVLFSSNVPYRIVSPVVPLLQISILPYEARPIIYEGAEDDAGSFLQPYETEIFPFIEYQSGNDTALSEMKKLRKIPFVPAFLSDKEKQCLAVKMSWQKLFLKTTGLYKFFGA